MAGVTAVRLTARTAPTKVAAALRTRGAALATALGVFALTCAVRLVYIGRSSDLFIDELIYRDVSISVAQGGFPRTDEGLFFLHPPGYFYLQAAWDWALGTGADPVSDVHTGRVLNCLLAGGTAVLLVLLVKRARSLRAGAVAGVLFALDPYIIRQNDRAMLDTATMMWVLAGFLVLLPLVMSDKVAHPVRRSVAVGVLFGLAVLTKDHAALITVLPLLLALVLRWGPPRRLLLIMMSVVVGMYAEYVLITAAAGHMGEFWYAKTHGVSRLLGLVQETGFNSEGTPSLAGRLASELGSFGPTYVLLALGPLAVVVLLRREDTVSRLMGLFLVSAGFTLVYALVGGTLEEQALYLLVVPNLVALAVAFPRAPSGDLATPTLKGVRTRRAAAEMLKRTRERRTAALVLTACVLAAASVSYGLNRTQRDDSFAQLRSYMAEHVPAGSAVVATDWKDTRSVTGWALKDRYRVGPWVTPQERQQARARYVVIPWKLVAQGYGELDMKQARSLSREGRLLQVTHGQMYGDLALYELPLPSPGSGKGVVHGG